MSASAVQARDLVVTRGGNEILHGLNFAIRSGEVTGLLGPSGSGKTTLLRGVIGLQKITAGTVTVLDLPAGAPALRTQIGYASQSASIYDDLTVLENLRYFAAAVRAPADDIDRVIEAVDLTRHGRTLAGALSGGERSRVSLAVAMLGVPKLLVLDEPTVGLDPVLREELWRLFHELADDGMSLIVSSHVMDEAERCDELLLLRAGALIAQDTAAGLRRRTGADSMDQAFLRLITAPAGSLNPPSPTGGGG